MRCPSPRRLMIGGSRVELTDCLEFATAHPICYLATEDDGQPRVRAQLMWFADERGFYFATMSPRSLSRQLHTNPKIEICFYNGASELEDARMMRVSGVVEFLNDEGLIRRAAEERSTPAEIIGVPLEPLTEVFRLRTGRVSFWGPGDIIGESQALRLAF
jgi:pyridoxamine 5'-phosphate oxidase